MAEKIAVIIPAKGDVAKTIGRCLKSVLDVEYPCFEIILVDDGMDDASRIHLAPFKDKITIMDSQGRGASFARNKAAKFSDAEFVAFTDSDCIVDKDWLKELHRAFILFPDASGCGGAQGVPDDATAFEKLVFRFMAKANFLSDYVRTLPQDEIVEVAHSPSCCVMYRRSVFLKEGGFLVGLWPGEDVEFDLRLRRQGYRLFFNPKAKVFHYKPKELSQFCKMMFRYGRIQGMLFRRYGFFRKIQLVPFLSLIALILVFRPAGYFLYVFIAVSFFAIWAYFSFSLALVFLAVLAFIFWNLGFFSGVFKRIK